MKTPASIFLLGFILVSCSKGVYIVKEDFKNTPTPKSPDYSIEESWAALPTKKDAADSIPLKSSLKNEQAFAKADVFFIYPTIFTEKPKDQFLWNVDVKNSDLNHRIQTTTILNQATIFNGVCKVYAPYYRQAHLAAFYTENKEAAKLSLDLAYQDVKTAFEYYLKNYNRGRPIVIASHSQGTYHARRLIKDYFDGKELQKQLVVAYLVGTAIPANAFENVRPTSRPDEIGVWASWNTFTRNFIPARHESFYKNSVSTNPLLWNSSEEFATRDLNKGGVGLKFTMVDKIVDAQNYQGLLWINQPYIRGRALLRTKVWHRADMNLFYVNIRENVALRVQKYFEQKGE
jgi:hypothetical protein